MEMTTPTFKLDHTIRIELEVVDENGVSEVGARFRLNREGSPLSFYRRIQLESEEQKVLATLEIPVTRAMAPGHYVCEYIALTDGLGNQSLIIDPGIEFDIEGTKENSEGPALTGWQFATA